MVIECEAVFPSCADCQQSPEQHAMPRFSSMILGAFIFRTAITVVLPAGAATEFRAAASKTDITPADSAIMWGYSDRSGPATGTHDPLHARILLLDDSSIRLAWVTLDLGRPFGNESMNLVRDRVRKSAGVTHVCFSASHTHSGPAIDEFYTAKRPAWETAALDKIAVAIESAATKLTPALIASGAGSVFIGHNRRFIQPDGKVKMLWRNQTKIPTHPLDPARRRHPRRQRGRQHAGRGDQLCVSSRCLRS